MDFHKVREGGFILKFAKSKDKLSIVVVYPEDLMKDQERKEAQDEIQGALKKLRELLEASM